MCFRAPARDEFAPSAYRKKQVEHSARMEMPDLASVDTKFNTTMPVRRRFHSWPLEKHRIEAQVKAAMGEGSLDALYEMGIIRPAEPPRPYAKGAKDKDGIAKMTVGKPETVDTKKLKGYIEMLCATQPDRFTLKQTEKGNVSVDEEWLNEHYTHDPVIKAYRHRQEYQKLLNTYLPAFDDPEKPGECVKFLYPGWNALVSTGRTSSMRDKTLPSLGIQNIDPRVRGIFVPREGFAMASSDLRASS